VFAHINTADLAFISKGALSTIGALSAIGTFSSSMLKTARFKGSMKIATNNTHTSAFIFMVHTP
jgi:hypothetical protein